MAESLKLLLIDDSSVDADILKNNLESIPELKFDLEWVTTFDEGLKATCERQYDIALVDHYLGPQTGTDLIRKAIENGCLRPLVLYSGKEDVRLGVQAIALGASDYLVKDHIEPFLLEKTLRNALERGRILGEHSRMQARMFETQRLESMGLMASGIAHDFNNILGIILANAELAQKQVLDSSHLARYLASIRQATERAADLTSQMLAYSGRGRFKQQSIDLAVLAKETLDFCRVGIPRRIDLDSRLPEQLPLIQGDITQMRQVLLNLINNAADSIEGEGAVTLRAGIHDAVPSSQSAQGFAIPLAEKQYIVLEVADTGCGIPDELLARIFDPFFTTKTTGRGLGLASVLGIVRSHKGSLRVQRRPQGGTSFEVWLPASEQNASTSTAEARIPAGEKFERATPSSESPFAPAPSGIVAKKSPLRPPAPPDFRVLVVDDEIGILQALEIMLQGNGYHTHLASSADEALEKIKSVPMDAAVLDIMLAGRSGVELFRDLRARKPDLPVVFISGYNESDAVLPLVQSGEVQYLRKPFSSNQLAEALSKACARQLVRMAS